MDKLATTTLPIHNLLQRRWSPRSFSDRPVDSHTVTKLLEAARWAPSWRNDQPWRFIVASKDIPESFQRLIACLKPGNRRWARIAPLLMIAITKTSYDHSDRPNPVTLYDTGQAVAQLTIEALAHDLYVHQMGGIHLNKIREVYGIPPGFRPVVALAIGYLGQPLDLPADLQQREVAPRTRLPLNLIAFSGAWGQPLITEINGNGQRKIQHSLE
jgi:nitroreductase